MSFPTKKQLNKFDCGVTCLHIILKYYGVEYNLDKLRPMVESGKKGASLLDLSVASEKLGFEATGVDISLGGLRKQKLPCIVYWKQNHFLVVHKITDKQVKVSDPGPGLLINYSISEFEAHWLSKDTENHQGYALLLKPTAKIARLKTAENKKKWHFLISRYYKPFKSYYLLIAVGMLIGLLLSFLTPFLTKSIVDIGIKEKDISFINLILLAQLVTAISSATLNALRNWMFLHMGWRMNFSAVSSFITKVMRLPVSFFDSSQVGDLLQRINDHSTLKTFVSASTFGVVFSFFNLIMFGGILAYYNLKIFLIFLVASVIYVFWVRLFMQKRKEFDYKMFDKNAASQNKLLQIFSGIKDIKLNNFEHSSRHSWEKIQAETFQVTARQMVINQYQQIGAFLIDISKSIFISYLTAKLVIQGEMTLGMMLSVQYILGQLNVPVAQFISFNNSLQDARISIDRINEIYNKDNEDEQDKHIGFVPGDIRFESISFNYGNKSAPVLKDIDIHIPEGKTTAIIGKSGSGKSTIIKLLLKFYNQYEGKILVNDTELGDMDVTQWRDNCASVLQDGFVFTDTLLSNIAFGDEKANLERVEQAARLANIHDYIMSLSDGYLTIVGTELNGLSQGQKQRLLIARAIYKHASYIFLDEPTTALDVQNEKIIMQNLLTHYKGKTVVIVAHRLGTIVSADQIIVMDNGGIAEQGTHEELIARKGLYEQFIQSYNHA